MHTPPTDNMPSIVAEFLAHILSHLVMFCSSSGFGPTMQCQSMTQGSADTQSVKKFAVPKILYKMSISIVV